MKSFIEIIKIEGNRFIIKNKKDEGLGMILFDNKWKRWIWELDWTKYTSECLEQIVNKLKELEKQKMTKEKE